MKKMSQDSQDSFTKIPSVNKILNSTHLADFRKTIRHDVLKKIIQNILESLRKDIPEGNVSLTEEAVNAEIIAHINNILQPSLKRVINATGIILNTNLGRAPLGDKLLQEIHPIISGYSNLEFDLHTGQRGSRHVHLKELLRLLLDCEDSVIVNNNAAALYLTLMTLSAGSEVIVSRGELVEIGGSFRIPDIIASSGAVMVEVGTTNKTKLKDYENAINDNTSAILKVHKSNYYIHGFTEEVSVADISKLANREGLLSIFDLGTGLADRTLLGVSGRQTQSSLEKEPDLKTAFKEGADIITFSCDKLLGGPQAGIIAGKHSLISQISQHPLMRVLRVDKLIISALYATMKNLMLNDDLIIDNIPLFEYLNRDEQELTSLASQLASKIKHKNIDVSVVDNEAKCGGGTLPDFSIKSKAVMIEAKPAAKSNNQSLTETLYRKLMHGDVPVVAILREGKLFFDVITIRENEIDEISNAVNNLLVAE